MTARKQHWKRGRERVQIFRETGLRSENDFTISRERGASERQTHGCSDLVPRLSPRFESTLFVNLFSLYPPFLLSCVLPRLSVNFPLSTVSIYTRRYIHDDWISFRRGFVRHRDCFFSRVFMYRKGKSRETRNNL